MNWLALSALLVLPTFTQEAAQPAKEVKEGKLQVHKIDGNWTPVYVEMDGKKIESKEFGNVIIKNNVLTYKQDGKDKSYRLEFGPHHMIRCTEQVGANTTDAKATGEGSKSSHTHHGVYISSHDYFCLCLNKGTDRRSFNAVREEGKAREDGKERNPSATSDRFEGHHPHGSGIVIILQRAGAASSDKAP